MNQKGERSMRHKVRLRLLAAASLVAFAMLAQQGSVQGQPAQAPPPLFAFVEPAGQRSLSAPQADRLQTYQADPSAAEVSVVRVQLQALRSADAVNLNLSPQRSVPLDRVRVEQRGPQSFSYFATSSSAPDEAIIVVDGKDVVGTIRSGGELYRLRPLDGDTQALIRVDRTKLPEEHPPEYQQLEERSRQRDRGELLQPRELQDPCTEYTAIVAYTPAAQAEAGGIDALIQLAIDETNQGYTNSGFNTKIKLVHKYQTNYTESADMALDRDRFRIKNDTYMDEVHGLRDQYAADVAILITKSGNYCGIAADIYASEDTAFAVVGQNCATGYYSFAHEIGHLQGARHNPEADPTTSPFAYGHGYYHEAGQWRTIMAYQCPAGCDRKNYWSNPNVSFGGVPMGTAATHHNARVLGETACRVANFRSTAVAKGPLAFGVVLANGQKHSGTTNWTSAYNPTYQRYEISISSENYYYLSYATNVTPAGDVRHCQSSSVGGQLLVYCTDVSGNPAPSRFGFATYKP
jgi:peptidyl-Asp metalloendopeptidase